LETITDVRRHSSPPRVAPQPYIRSHPPCVIKPYRFVWPSCSTSRGGPRERLSSAHHPASRSGRGARGLSRRPYIYFVLLLLSFRSARALSHARCVEPYGSHSAATRSTVRLPTRPRRHLPCLSRAYVYPSTWRRAAQLALERRANSPACSASEPTFIDAFISSAAAVDAVDSSLRVDPTRTWGIESPHLVDAA
jgi:hypothetical protein